MEQDHDKALKEIMGGIECHKDFTCYKSGFEDLCKAQDIGLESYIECLEKHPFECKFSLSYGGLYYCSCPMRIYIARNLNK